jgi:hypothetical protein
MGKKSELPVGGIDYPQKRYYYYIGKRRGLLSAIQTPLGRLGYAEISYAGSMDEVAIGKAEDTVNTQRVSSHFLLIKAKTPVHRNLTVVSQFRILHDSKDESPADTSLSFKNTRFPPTRATGSPFNATLSLESASELFNIAAGYSPGLRMWGVKRWPRLGTFRWTASTKMGMSINNALWEHNAGLEWEKEITPGYSLRTGLAARSMPSCMLSITSPAAEYMETRCRINSLGISVTTNAGKFGTGLLYLSPYTNRIGWNSSITWNGLDISAGLNYYGKSWWNDAIIPVARTDVGHLPGAVLLPAYLKADIAGTYGIAKDRVRLSIAVRNIGRQHRELPNGSIIGPIIITNLRVLIGDRRLNLQHAGYDLNT